MESINTELRGKDQLSPFHQSLVAHELTLRRPAGDRRKLTRSLSSASVDLQPHQIDAALFAFQSPLSRGALLADEVGLGKTIEAGLVIAQLWAEGRRRIVILVPASLRKQWQNELFEKFGLPAWILEGPSPSGQNPFFECFQKGEIAICSLHYAYRRLDRLQRAKPFDLVAIDEAHHFRNVWKGNKMARKIREVLREEPKLLLSATPLHNNLMELYGLVSFIDRELLGTRESFRFRFVGDSRSLQALNVEEMKERLKGISKRTLRRQVQEYVRFTERKAELFPFTPYEDEHELYEKVSEYLRRERLAAVPHRQRTLMLLVYRKILASSSFAIAGTLEKLIRRLEKLLRGEPAEAEDGESLLEDVDGFEEEREELGEDEEVIAVGEEEFTREEIEAELAELREYRNLALNIKRNAKGEALLRALQQIFTTRKEGRPEKAVVFTEFRRTQQYLGGVVGIACGMYLTYIWNFSAGMAAVIAFLVSLAVWNFEWRGRLTEFLKTISIAVALFQAFNTISSSPDLAVTCTTTAEKLQGENTAFLDVMEKIERSPAYKLSHNSIKVSIVNKGREPAFDFKAYLHVVHPLFLARLEVRRGGQSLPWATSAEEFPAGRYQIQKTDLQNVTLAFSEIGAGETLNIFLQLLRASNKLPPLEQILRTRIVVPNVAVTSAEFPLTWEPQEEISCGR